MKNSKSDKIHILHISDLHITSEQDARNWCGQLADDLKGGLGVGMLTAAVVSGDIGNHSLEEEYDTAKVFFDLLKAEFKLDASRVILVPGNHDLNWKLSKKGYKLMEREDCQPEQLKPGLFIEVDPEVVRIRDDAKYKNRFANFGAFYESVRGAPYPSDYDHQATFHFFPECNILIVGFNSAWQIDHEFRARADIHPGAVTEALNRIRNTPDFENAVKVAAFHHPVESRSEDRIVDSGFLERLAVNGFCLCLHGHIHKSDSRMFNYDVPAGDRSLRFVGAGTFGAPMREWAYGHPLQYNLLEFSGAELTVRTRHRIELNGAWEPHCIWRRGPGKDPSSAYTVKLPKPVGKTESEDGAKDHYESLPEVPKKYRDWVAGHCRDMDLDKLIGTGPVIQARLPEIFIPLYAVPPERENSFSRNPDEMRLMDHRRSEDITSLFAKHPAVIVRGDAGSGKTTLLKHTAWSVIHGNPPRGLDAVLPVLVFLKGLDAESTNRSVKNAKAFEDLLDRYYENREAGLSADIVRPWAKSGKAMLLLDGLDEITPDFRAHIVESLAGFRRDNPNCRVVLSGRPHGIDRDAAVIKWIDAPVLTIEKLNPDQIRRFINNWFAHVSDTEAFKKTAEDMIGEINAHPNIGNLVDNPLMLTAVCLLYLDDRELPEQRAELYHKFVENLIHRRFRDRQPERIRNFLISLARHMHEKRTREIGKLEAVSVLCEAFADDPACHGAMEARFDDIESACALLVFDKGRYMFRHLTFQEFLTAVSLRENVREDHFAAIAGHWGDHWYDEVAELYVGYLSIQDRGIANEIVRKVLDGEAGDEYKKWRLAGRALLDIHIDRRDSEVATLARKKMAEIMTSAAPPKKRAEAGELLGRLGDPRSLNIPFRETDKFKTFIPIKAGKYKLSMGKVRLGAFEIGKYPVTNAWFREFVEAGGYGEPEFWTEQGLVFIEKRNVKAPAWWHERKWNCPNAPVVGVSWYEADAFVRWLNAAENDGRVYSLPDEHQWEAAAAGKEGRKYP